MEINQIKELVAGPSYKFLRTNEHLGNRIIFLTLGGSHAYGTNIETSDVDVRGCALNRKSDLIGMSNFEQVEDNIKTFAECKPLTDIEKEYLPFSAKYITFEQVLRFLMDYIDGDTYYKIKYPEHNLVRARAQLKLLKSIEESI